MQKGKNTEVNIISLKDSLVREVKERLKDRLSKEVEIAFRRIPRHIFVSEFISNLEEAYRNENVLIKDTLGNVISFSSQPMVIASMLEMLNLLPNLKVLEIGTGTGYNFALMTKTVKDVSKIYSVEINPDLVQMAKNNLSKVGYKNTNIFQEDGRHGFPEGSPYDRIIVTAEAQTIYYSWFKQLNNGGILVVPLFLPCWFIESECKGIEYFYFPLKLYRKHRKLVGQFKGMPVIFMPLLGGERIDKNEVMMKLKPLIKYVSKRTTDNEEKLKDLISMSLFIILELINQYNSFSFPMLDNKELEMLIDKWVKLGKPKIDQFKIEVYFSKAKESKMHCILNTTNDRIVFKI